MLRRKPLATRRRPGNLRNSRKLTLKKDRRNKKSPPLSLSFPISKPTMLLPVSQKKTLCWVSRQTSLTREEEEAEAVNTEAVSTEAEADSQAGSARGAEASKLWRWTTDRSPRFEERRVKSTFERSPEG